MRDRKEIEADAEDFLTQHETVQQSQLDLTYLLLEVLLDIREEMVQYRKDRWSND